MVVLLDLLLHLRDVLVRVRTNPRCALDLGSATANDDSASFSSDRFMILPKVNTTNRNNLNNLTAGAVIYNTSLNKIQVYTGSGWETVTSTANMATPSSGQISATNISDEFGRNLAGNQMSLGGYRLAQTVGTLSFNGIDSGVPTSGEIKFSDFYNKRLNVVVDFHSGGQEIRQNAKNRYNGNNVTVIGGFRGTKEAGSISYSCK